MALWCSMRARSWSHLETSAVRSIPKFPADASSTATNAGSSRTRTSTNSRSGFAGLLNKMDASDMIQTKSINRWAADAVDDLLGRLQSMLDRGLLLFDKNDCGV
jgi:hypothetical protein